eukprot:JP439167.1.p2 GENE.JP439167.1~~JP439167.1.p2  ORF type:complete len:90 (-),score=9.43 JP439167.1:21-290(-)
MCGRFVFRVAPCSGIFLCFLSVFFEKVGCVIPGVSLYFPLLHALLSCMRSSPACAPLLHALLSCMRSSPACAPLLHVLLSCMRSCAQAF